MIEIKGHYFHQTNKDTSRVLIQFDGETLHIWHLSYPFFRLAAFKRFSVAYGDQGIIKLPGGAFVKTNDIKGIKILKSKLTDQQNNANLRLPYSAKSLLFVILILVFLNSWWLII
ncbi:MAG: hypothetical protein GY874_20590 [Desulfobacteraceae bacterium]|nr:hypothetical protein [Desulfobacteraceae bacterium]